MPIKKLPIDSQPREKLLSLGKSGLTDIELLSIIINSGSPDWDALDIAKSLYSSIAKTSEIKNLTFADLISIRGIGKAKAIKLLATIELATRINSQPLDEPLLDNIQSLANNFNSRINNKNKEHFMIFIFGKDGDYITTKMLNIGTIDTVEIDPTEIIESVIKYGGRKFYCIHNHPSGIIQPSQADELLTQRIKNYCELFRIKFLGHIIVNSKGDYSVME